MITVDSIWIDFDMCKLHSSLLRPNSQKNPPQWLLEFAFKYLKIERGMWKKNTFIYRLCIILLCKDLEIRRGMGKTNKLTGEFNLPHGILEILDFKAVLRWSLAYAGGLTGMPSFACEDFLVEFAPPPPPPLHFQTGCKEPLIF